MQGLRTQESDKFKTYFGLVQAAAHRQNAAFFLDCGEGNELSTDDMECEDLSGWLVPEERVDEFEPLWKTFNEIPDSLDVPFYRFAEWSLTDDAKIIIQFKKY